MEPKVSVIVPIYNAEKYLDRCIRSIINQTLTEIEILLLDDHSLDTSLIICNMYKNQDNRIRVFSNSNVGQGIERNYGINFAKGKYIAFLDSDDSYEVNMLEKMYSLAEKEQADMVSCGYMDIYLNEVVKKHPLKNEILDKHEKICISMANLIAKKEQDGYEGCIAVWDSLFRKKIIDEYRIKFTSERQVYSEDLLFKLEFMSHASKIVLCKDLLYRYSITESSFTNNVNTHIIDRIILLHKTIIKKFEFLLKDYDLDRRITNRTFFTIRFNMKKASQSLNYKEFYKYICEIDELQMLINKYKPQNLRNLLIYVLIKLRNYRLICLILKERFKCKEKLKV